MMQQEELERLGRDWQKRLRLLDWNIVFQIVPAHELENVVGCCRPWCETKEAVIKVADQVNSNYSVISAAIPTNHEEVVVHELIEIYFDPFKADKEKEPAQHRDQEIAINMLAQALVNAKRGNGHSIEYAMKESELLAESVR